MRLFVVLALLSGLAQIHAQTDRGTVNSDNADYQFRSFLFALDYANNSDVIGKLSETINQPSYSASVAFFDKTGLDIMASGIYTGNSNDSLNEFTSQLDLMAGYRIRITEKWSVYPSYSRFFYGRNTSTVQKMFTDDIRLDIDFNHQFLFLSVSPGFYLGSSSTFYTNVGNYYNINLNNVIFRNTLLNMQPGFDLNFGDFEYLNRFYIDQLRESDSFYLYLLSSRDIRRYVNTKIRENPELTYVEVLDEYLNRAARDSFKLTSLTFYLPISYLAGNFGFSLGIFAFVPINQPDYLYNDTQFFFDVGLSYSIVM